MTGAGVAYVRSTALMGTVVTIEVVGGSVRGADHHRDAAVTRALEWFRAVEACCSRFDPDSEVSRLAARVGEAVPASTMLVEGLAFALALADETGGAFDPTVGHLMEARGDNVEYRTGARVRTAPALPMKVSYRDVRVDAGRETITLRRPLMLDLGAVAKGLAVDLAARELRGLKDFAIDAGGDLYLGGVNATGDPWAVGVRHPRDASAIVQTVRASNAAVCTSGDYERRSSSAPATDHHIIDPRTGHSATASASATVIAPSAMVADALATAAFVLGPADGLALLERHGVEGLIITDSLEQHATPGFNGLAAGHAS